MEYVYLTYNVWNSFEYIHHIGKFNSKDEATNYILSIIKYDYIRVCDFVDEIHWNKFTYVKYDHVDYLLNKDKIERQKKFINLLDKKVRVCGFKNNHQILDIKGILACRNSEYIVLEDSNEWVAQGLFVIDIDSIFSVSPTNVVIVTL